jgi:hypothetical protein
MLTKKPCCIENKGRVRENNLLEIKRASETNLPKITHKINA